MNVCAMGFVGFHNSGKSQLEVMVNGVPLGMNPFVASILTSTMRGMLSLPPEYAPGRIQIRVEEP